MVYSLQSTYILQSLVYSIHYSVYNLQFLVYSLQTLVYGLQSLVYILWYFVLVYSIQSKFYNPIGYMLDDLLQLLQLEHTATCT